MSVGEAAAEPSAVVHALEGLARLIGMEAEDMRSLVFANFRAVLERAPGGSPIGKDAG